MKRSNIKNSIKKNQELLENIADFKNSTKDIYQNFMTLIRKDLIKNKENEQSEEEINKNKQIEELLTSCKKLIHSNFSEIKKIRKSKEIIQFETFSLENYNTQLKEEQTKEINTNKRLQNEILQKKIELEKLENINNKLRKKLDFEDPASAIIIIEPEPKILQLSHENIINKNLLRELRNVNRLKKRDVRNVLDRVNHLSNAKKIQERKKQKFNLSFDETNKVANDEENKNDKLIFNKKKPKEVGHFRSLSPK